MYHVDIDIAGVPDNRTAVRLLQQELTPKISTTVLELEGLGGGNPFVRLRSASRTRLERYLKLHHYDDEVVDERNPDAIPHRRSSDGTA